MKEIHFVEFNNNRIDDWSKWSCQRTIIINVTLGLVDNSLWAVDAINKIER